jgi:hypothetical protein
MNPNHNRDEEKAVPHLLGHPHHRWRSSMMFYVNNRGNDVLPQATPPLTTLLCILRHSGNTTSPRSSAPMTMFWHGLLHRHGVLEWPSTSPTTFWCIPRHYDNIASPRLSAPPLTFRHAILHHRCRSGASFNTRDNNVPPHYLHYRRYSGCTFAYLHFFRIKQSYALGG